MRALLLILAGLSAIAAALFFGPRLLDGELARDRLLARLEQATGEPARALGPTQVTFLPQPNLSIGQLVIGDPGRGVASVSIERVDLVLGVGGLLGLGTGPREVRLIRPQLRASALPDLAGLARLLERLQGEGLPVDALSVASGRVLVRDARLAAPLELDELDLELAREIDGGPLVLTGGGRWRGQSLAVELEMRLAAAGPHAVRLKLAVGTGPTASRLAYRGGVDLGRRWLDGEIEVAADPRRLAPLLAALGADRLAERLVPIGAFAARGRLHGEANRLATEGLRIATAAGEFGLRGELALAEPASFRLEIEAARLELPTGFEPQGLLPAFWAGPPAGLVGSVVGRIGALTRSGEELRLVRLEMHLPGDGGLVLDTLGAELPGTGDLELSGRLARETGGPSFRGRLALRVEDPRPTLTWLGYRWPGPPEPSGALAIAGELAATPEALSLADGEIRLAGSRAQGTFAILAGPPARLRLLGGIDRLALDTGLEGALGEQARAWLQAGPPSGFEAELDLLVERIAWRGLRAERVRLRGELAGGRLRIDELASPALAGGAARLAGSLGPGSAADLALELEAEQPARLARALAIDPTLPALLEGPLRARAELREDDQGRRLAVEIATAEAKLQGEIGLVRGSLDPERGKLAIAVADTAALAARFAGRGAVAPGLAGRLSGALEALRTAAGWRIEGRVGTEQLALAAALELVEAHGVPLLRGRLGLERVRPTSLADLYRLLEAPLGLPAGPLRAWPGAWPRRPFGPPRLVPVDLDLALEIALEREDGTPLGRGGALLALAGRAFALDAIDLPFAEGRLAGRLLAELDDEAGRLEAELRLASAALPLLAEAVGVGEPGRGTLDLELAVASEGRSLAELVGNASGRGVLVLRELDGPDLAAAGVGNLLLRGPFALERGILRAADLALDAAGAAGRAGLAFDLAAWILDLELEAPAGRLRLFGPPDRLRRYGETVSGGR